MSNVKRTEERHGVLLQTRREAANGLHRTVTHGSAQDLASALPRADQSCAERGLVLFGAENDVWPLLACCASGKRNGYTIEFHPLTAVEETAIAEGHISQVLELRSLAVSGVDDELEQDSQTFFSSSDQVGVLSAMVIWLRPC